MAESAAPPEGAPAERELIRNGALRVARCRHGLMLYNVNDVFIGRSLSLYGEYLENEIKLYRLLVGADDLVVDGGANIGCFTLYFARAVGAKGAVYAFEPQRLIYQNLCANMALNGIANVAAWQAGLGAEPGTMTVPWMRYDRPGNFGGVALAAEGPGDKVQITTIDALDLPRCKLIKIDVQGMEGEVLRGAEATIAKFRPYLYVENDIRESSPALIQQLFDLDYRLYWHRPIMFNQDNFYGHDENVFVRRTEAGVLIRLNINMFCVPKPEAREFGLPEITSTEAWWEDA